MHRLCYLRLLVSRCITLQKLHRSVLSRYTELAADNMKRKRPATPTEQPVVKQLRLQQCTQGAVTQQHVDRLVVAFITEGLAALRDGGAASVHAAGDRLAAWQDGLVSGDSEGAPAHRLPGDEESSARPAAGRCLRRDHDGLLVGAQPRVHRRDGPLAGHRYPGAPVCRARLPPYAGRAHTRGVGDRPRRHPHGVRGVVHRLQNDDRQRGELREGVLRLQLPRCRRHQRR